MRLVVPKPGMVKAWMRSRGTPSGVHRLARHQQGQRRIESAGDADGDRRLADVLQPLGQAGDLGVEDLLAALAQLLLSVRHERMGVDRPRAGRSGTCCSPSANGDASERRRSHARIQLGVAEAVGAQAVGAEAVEIDVGDEQSVCRAGSARDSASSVPFSAIRQWPPKTTSVVDSPTPQEA